MLRLALLAMVAGSLPVAALAAPTEESELAKRIDLAVAPYRAAPITGMTVAVSRNGDIVLERGYGLADVEAGLRADGDTVYEIGSITKQFTAAAVLRLAEQGKLGLDDPIAKHLPELGDAAPGVTLRHLLSHVSGLYAGALSDDSTKPLAAGRLFEALAENPPTDAPGARYRYNNNGYHLLGRVIERASGMAYGDYLAAAFFRPLGLGSAALCETPRRAGSPVGYSHATRGPASAARFEVHHPSASFAAGAVCATAADMLRWQDALVKGRAVSRASYRLMATPATLNDGRKAPYGMGFEIGQAGDEAFVHHGGAASGFITDLAYHPADDIGVAVFTNGIYAGGIVEQVEQAVVRAARGLEPEPPVDLPLAADTRHVLAGKYALGPTIIEVYEQGDHLRAQPPGQVAARLLHQGGNRFIAQHDPRLGILFEAGSDGTMEMRMSQSGKALPPARRVTP